ncbi:MAG: GlmU family protein [Robiginitalea sp.]
MHYILFDGDRRTSLLPLTYTRPVAAIRTGILTLKEKWEHHLGNPVGYLTQPYLQEKYPVESGTDNLLIKGSLFADALLARAVKALNTGEALYSGDAILAYRTATVEHEADFSSFKKVIYEHAVREVRNTRDIFSMNGKALEEEFELLTRVLEAGAVVEYSLLNATSGPISIGREAAVMEGSLIRGGFALGDHGVVKMGAKIYGPTTAGPYCKIGGEINNSVLFGYSNKGHEGFLGNSVLGEWCNLGADTNTSNLKNNYAKVRLWNYASERFDQTGLQFCGLIMGDHSKSAINTMFNTGTVVGVNCNIFSAGFPRNFIPSYSWGGTSGFSTYLTKKAFEAAEVAMARRNVPFTGADKRILQRVFEESAKYRNS